ncbi:MAG: ABC transporter permease [Saccharofermentans sp.]|nr:ABC transporter permease [Saccharofermentans sp.]
MLKLLIFEFRRIAKSVFFWIVAAYSFVWPVIVALFYRAVMSIDLSEGIKFNPVDLDADSVTFLTWMLSVAFLTELPKFIALFTCLHLGRDYTDGIVRNKIIAGHSRLSIYCSYLITQIAASVVLCVIYILSSLFGLAVSGIGVNVNGGEMFARFAVGIVVFLVMTVTFSVLSLMFRKRALPVILCILIAMSSNAAAAVIGNFNMPSKACKDYLKIRNDHYEELADEGIVDEQLVEQYEDECDEDFFLGIGWKIFHPVYVLSPIGFEGDYSAGGMTTMTFGGSTEYTDEIDFSSKLYYSDDSIYMIARSLNPDISSSTMSAEDIMLSPKAFRKTDSLHLEYSTLNWIYVGKSLLWMAVIAAYGYVVFKRKNMF